MVGSTYSDDELIERVNELVVYYTNNGDSHYDDTKDWRILEIYWNRILDKLLNDLEIDEQEVEQMSERITNLF